METTLEWFLGAGIVTVLVAQFIAIVRSKTMKAIITTPPEPREAPVSPQGIQTRARHPRSSRSPHSAARGGGRSSGWSRPTY